MPVVTFNLLIPAEQSLAWLVQITSLKLTKSFPCSKKTQNTLLKGIQRSSPELCLQSSACGPEYQ